jgi:hypothetical protein
MSWQSSKTCPFVLFFLAIALIQPGTKGNELRNRLEIATRTLPVLK